MAPAASSTAGMPMPEYERHTGPLRGLVEEVGAGLADDAVDVAGPEPGVGERTHAGGEGDAARVVPFEHARLLGVEHADDGDVVERVRRHAQLSRARGRARP